MIKKVLIFMLSAMLVFMMAGCQSKNAGSSSSQKKELSSIDKIKQAGKIVVGTESTFPPFESIDPKDGKTVIGFDMDIAKAVADKLGVKLEIKDMEFKGLLGALPTGMIDFVAAGVNITDERKAQADFSEAYYKGGQVLVVSENNNSINSAADMKGKNIGAQLGTTSEKAAQTINGINYKALDKVDQLMLQVKNGSLDGVVVDDTVGVQYSKSLGGLKIIKVPELNSGDNGMGIAVKKGNTELLKVINDTINELKSNGQYDKLIDKWGLLK